MNWNTDLEVGRSRALWKKFFGDLQTCCQRINLKNYCCSLEDILQCTCPSFDELETSSSKRSFSFVMTGPPCTCFVGRKDKRSLKVCSFRTFFKYQSSAVARRVRNQPCSNDTTTVFFFVFHITSLSKNASLTSHTAGNEQSSQKSTGTKCGEILQDWAKLVKALYT